MILELVPAKEIFELVKVSDRLGEDAGRFFLKQLVEGLEYMHN